MECEFNGCLKKYYAKGLCSAHYAQRRKGNGLRPLLHRINRPKAPCSFDSCDRSNYAKALCRAHYGQYQRGTELHAIGTRLPLNRPECEYIECTRDGVTRGLCKGHYMQRYVYKLEELRALRHRPASNEVYKDDNGSECTKCGKYKPYADYYYRKNQGSYRSECKKCIIEREKERKRSKK